MALQVELQEFDLRILCGGNTGNTREQYHFEYNQGREWLQFEFSVRLESGKASSVVLFDGVIPATEYSLVSFVARNSAKEHMRECQKSDTSSAASKKCRLDAYCMLTHNKLRRM